MMNKPTTIILLVLFFGGLAGLWVAERVGVPTSEEIRRRSGRVLPELIDVAPEDVVRVEVLGGGTSPIAFERRGDDWRMVEPLAAPADPSRIEALILALKQLPRPAGGEPLKGSPRDYGLDPPVRTIRLYAEDKEGPIASLAVGQEVRDGRYVQPEGRGEVEVVEALSLAGIDRPVHEWRDRTVFHIPEFEVERFEVVGGGRTLAAVREGNSWRLVEPIQAPGNVPRIEGLLAGLTGLRVVEGAEGYVADDVTDFSPYGLNMPKWRITLQSSSERSGPEDVVLIGDPVPEHPGRFFARKSDADNVVAVEGRGLASLDDDPHVFRSRRVAVLDPSAVQRLRIESGDVVQEIVRQEDGWRLRQPVEGQADPTLVHALIGEINALEATDLFEPDAVPDSGRDRPSAVVSVWENGQDADPSLRLSLGRRNRVARTLYARAEGDPAVLALPVDALDDPFSDQLAFLDHEMLRFNGPTRGITLRREGRTFKLLAPEPPGNAAGWRMVEPVEAVVDPEAVSLLDALLSNIRADRLIERGTPDRAAFGLDEPWAVAEREVPSGVQPPPPLIVGDEVPDGSGSRYAIVEGRPLVFTLAPQAVAILDREPHDRSVFDFDPAQVEGLVIRRPGREQVLRHAPKPFTGGLEWIPEPGSDVTDLNFPSLDTMVAALARLKTPRFVQYEGALPRGSGLDHPTLELTFQLSGGLATRRLRIGSPTDGGFRLATAAEGDAGAVFLIPAGGAEPWSFLLPRTEAPKPTPEPPVRELPADPFVSDESRP